MINSQVASSSPVMPPAEIAPLYGHIPGAARIRPAGIAFLRQEQAAQVKLSAYDFAIYGLSPAKLEHISADTITHESGERFFLIRARTERSYLGTEADPPEIIPGMTRWLISSRAYRLSLTIC
ncbi:MAG TPA: hypothetical protein VM011_02605 [Gammaproteobacteria bacterium]|nr:hypothetical protein [Gammaproteobacteria bacterium]